MRSWYKSNFIIFAVGFWVLLLFLGTATGFFERDRLDRRGEGTATSTQQSEIIIPRGVYQESFQVVFDRETRDLWQKPDQVIEAIGRLEGLTVADIGCGEGYFTKRLAVEVGPAGRVFASDIQEEVLNHMVQSLEPDIANRVVPILATEDGLGIPEPVDLVFLVQVLGEVPSQRAFLKKVMAIMKPEARLVLIDSKHITDPVSGYSRPQNLARLRQDLAREGLVLATEPLHFLPKQFFFILQKERE